MLKEIGEKGVREKAENGERGWGRDGGGGGE